MANLFARIAALVKFKRIRNLSIERLSAAFFRALIVREATTEFDQNLIIDFSANKLHDARNGTLALATIGMMGDT